MERAPRTASHSTARTTGAIPRDHARTAIRPRRGHARSTRARRKEARRVLESDRSRYAGSMASTRPGILTSVVSLYIASCAGNDPQRPTQVHYTASEFPSGGRGLGCLAAGMAIDEQIATVRWAVGGPFVLARPA